MGVLVGGKIQAFRADGSICIKGRSDWWKEKGISCPKVLIDQLYTRKGCFDWWKDKRHFVLIGQLL